MKTVVAYIIREGQVRGEGKYGGMNGWVQLRKDAARFKTPKEAKTWTNDDFRVVALTRTYHVCEDLKHVCGKCGFLWPERSAYDELILKNANLEEKLKAANALITLLETCAACSASLHGPEIDLEAGAPYCLDCSPTEDQRDDWLDKVQAARKLLNGEVDDGRKEEGA